MALNAGLTRSLARPLTMSDRRVIIIRPADVHRARARVRSRFNLMGVKHHSGARRNTGSPSCANRSTTFWVENFRTLLPKARGSHNYLLWLTLSGDHKVTAAGIRAGRRYLQGRRTLQAVDGGSPSTEVFSRKHVGSPMYRASFSSASATAKRQPLKNEPAERRRFPLRVVIRYFLYRRDEDDR